MQAQRPKTNKEDCTVKTPNRQNKKQRRIFQCKSRQTETRKITKNPPQKPKKWYFKNHKCRKLI